MRTRTAWAAAFVCVAVTAAFVFGGQEASTQARPAPEQPKSSLALGVAHDHKVMFAFAEQLTPEERQSLVRLRSRFELADPACPLPAQATMPFYVRFRSPMGRAFAQKLKDAGATFVGYAAEHTHFVRARDGESLKEIGAMLRGSANVAGTLSPRTEDRMTRAAWKALQNTELAVGDYRIQFWGDVSAGAASALIETPGAELVQADFAPDGSLDMDTRYMDVRLTREALGVFANSPLIEMIDWAYPIVHDNVISAGMVKALPTDIGPGTIYNLTGEGMIVGVWDGGRARDTHVGLQGAYAGGPFDNGTKRVLTGSVINSDPNFSYISISDTAGISSHATHVTGTVLGDGTGEPDGTGFAPRAYAVSLNSSNVDAERRTIRHHFRHVIDTHSYGAQGGSSGGYHATAANWDIDIRDLLLKVNRSAGNEANGGNNDDNTIGDDTCFKNGMIIGAAQDNGDIASFSSRGPSDDGRLMPHFMLNGVGLLSTYSGSDTQYNSISGTSMSTPSATGAQTLLSELYMREMGRRELTPDTAKVLLALTSTDVYNPGPDYRYGYGIPDIKRAADLILANKASGESNLIRGAVRQGSTMEWELEVTSSADPLRVVCSWLDVQASTQAIPTLINDIDVELIEPNGTTIHYPYSGIPATQGTQTHRFTNTGPNRYDNTEYIEVASPAVGTWVVRVSGFNIPSNPQSGVPNDVCGFVLGCERPFTIHKESAQDVLNTTGPIAIPDNDVDGVSRTFTFTEMRKTIGVRVHLDVKHTARGDLDVYLEHPDGTIVHIETADTSTRDDLIAVYPDTRQYDDDVTALLGKRPAGTWKVTVTDTVSGDTGEIRYLSLEVDVDPKNSAPEAVAGPDRTVIEGIVVTLDGTGSSDFDFHPLTYSWAEVGSSLLTLSGANTATATFTTPAVATNTMVTVQLTVDDGNGGSDTDDIVFTIVPPGTNSPPTAGAGPDQFVKFGATVTLAGTASDPDADSLTFLWTQVSGKTTVVISGANSLSPTFTAPGTNDSLEFELRVTDLVGYEVTDKVRIGVNASGKAPAPRETGGGGCAVAGAALSPLILIPAFAILVRRRRRARHGEQGA